MKYCRSFVLIGLLAVGSPIYALSSSDKVSYKEAKKLYDAKEFDRSYTILSSRYLEGLEDAEFNFYLGRCAYEIGEYAIALAAYERAVMLEPENLHYQFERAKTQYDAGLLIESEAGFKTIVTSPEVSNDLRDQAENYLGRMVKPPQRNFFSAAARAGFVYDSNVNFGSSDETYTLPSYGVFFASPSLSDTAHEETLRLTHAYDFGVQGGAVLRNQLGLYNRRYSDEHRYDFTLLSFNPALIYTDERSVYELTGGIARVSYGGDGYYYHYSLQPKWTYAYSSQWRQTAAVTIGRKNYIRSENNDLESRKLQLQGGMDYFLNATESVRGELLLSRQIKENGDRPDVNYDETEFHLLYTNQLRPMSIVQADLKLKKRYYDDYSTLFHSHRYDETVYGSINFIQRLTDAVSLELMGNYHYTDSTISIYDFNKYTLTLSVSTRF